MSKKKNSEELKARYEKGPMTSKEKKELYKKHPELEENVSNPPEVVKKLKEMMKAKKASTIRLARAERIASLYIEFSANRQFNKIARFGRNRITQEALRAFDAAVVGAKLGDPITEMIGESVIGRPKRMLFLAWRRGNKKAGVIFNYLNNNLRRIFIQDLRRHMTRGATVGSREHDQLVKKLSIKYRKIIEALSNKAFEFSSNR